MSKHPKIPGTPAQPQAMQIRGITIPLEGIPINVIEAPDGQVFLELGPIAMKFVVPMTKQGAHDVAHALGGGKVLIARGLPTDGE